MDEFLVTVRNIALAALLGWLGMETRPDGSGDPENGGLTSWFDFASDR